MKQFIKKLTILALLMGFFMTPQYILAQGSDFSVEKVGKECKGIPREKRIRVRVSRFSVSSKAAQATGQFGEELTAIMTNALQQINCYRVLETLKNKGDANEEIAENESGSTNGNGAKRGKKLSAQGIVTAEITEYSEGKTGLNIGIISGGKDKAKLGLIIKMVDPETSEVLWSKSVNGEGSKSGVSGLKILGISLVGSSKLSEAMSAAVEDIVLKTVALLVKEKDEIEKLLPNPTDDLAKPKVWNTENCTMLQGGNGPKVMAIIPEIYISTRGAESGAETEILRKFMEAGFRAIDPSVYATIRSGARFIEAANNPMTAISMGKEFGADIVIFGEAVSQYVSKDANSVTCRAQLTAKAVRTDNAEMIATNSAEAGGQDLAEIMSAKRAIKNAGAQVGDYMLGQFCSKNISFGGGDKQGISAVHGGKKTTISVTNVNFAKLNTLATTLKSNSKVKDVQKSLNGTEGSLTISHEGSTDDIAELINASLAAQFEITGVESGKISLTGK